MDFDAGSYAPYVWGAYGLTILVLGWLIASTLLRARRWRREARRLGDEDA